MLSYQDWVIFKVRDKAADLVENPIDWGKLYYRTTGRGEFTLYHEQVFLMNTLHKRPYCSIYEMNDSAEKYCQCSCETFPVRMP